MSRPVAAVDLDGTLAEYDEWAGEEEIGDALPGAVEFLVTMNNTGFDIVIFSARAGTETGINAIWKWLTQNGLNMLVSEVTNVKQYRFAVMIDDRAIPFAKGQEGGYSPVIDWARVRCGVKSDEGSQTGS